MSKKEQLVDQAFKRWERSQQLATSDVSSSELPSETDWSNAPYFVS